MRSELAVVVASTYLGRDHGLYRGVRFVSDSGSLSFWQPVKARKRTYVGYSEVAHAFRAADSSPVGYRLPIATEPPQRDPVNSTPLEPSRWCGGRYACVMRGVFAST
jgi:hypothetical protein